MSLILLHDKSIWNFYLARSLGAFVGPRLYIVVFTKAACNVYNYDN